MPGSQQLPACFGAISSGRLSLQAPLTPVSGPSIPPSPANNEFYPLASHRVLGWWWHNCRFVCSLARLLSLNPHHLSQSSLSHFCRSRQTTVCRPNDSPGTCSHIHSRLKHILARALAPLHASSHLFTSLSFKNEQRGPLAFALTKTAKNYASALGPGIQSNLSSSRSAASLRISPASPVSRSLGGCCFHV